MIRKLDRLEHVKTRALWEEIFSQDSKEFLDYYYSVKTAENGIYVVEEDEGIRAMLQLNPFEVVAEEYCGKVNYIVGVATEEAYRGRKFMAKLLKKALEDMYEDGQAFTFLMPAAEAIYKPHGFRFVYRQKRCMIAGKGMGFPERIFCQKAEEKDCREIAEFASEYLSRCESYSVYTRRTEAYYKMLLAEQKSENGGILLLWKENAKDSGQELIGCVHFAEEGDYMEIREPLIADGYKELLGSMVHVLTRYSERKIVCQAYEEEMLSEKYAVWEEETEKPIIMVRVVNLEKFFKCFRAKEDFEMKLQVKDEILEQNSGLWKISGRTGESLRAEKVKEKYQAGYRGDKNGEISEEIFVEAAELSEKETEIESVSVETLVSCLSGYLCCPDIPEVFAKLLEKTALWKNVFLNEIV